MKGLKYFYIFVAILIKFSLLFYLSMQPQFLHLAMVVSPCLEKAYMNLDLHFQRKTIFHMKSFSKYKV